MALSLQDQIDALYDEVKSHTRSCECSDCYRYEALLRRREQKNTLGKLEPALFSNEYPCPGDHRKDGVQGDAEDYPEEMMDELGFPEDWKYPEFASDHPEEFKRLHEAMEKNWVEAGECPEKIEMYIETDGEYGEISYPVAHGPCVEALGMDEEPWSHRLYERHIERKNLRKLLP